MIRIVSLNIGRPKELAHGAESVQSAIAREPISNALELGKLNLRGDAVADTKHHGGADKAVNVYPSEHYAHWKDRLERALAMPAFGENFTTDGLLEADVCIGDSFRVGSSIVQVSQPRVPCYKPAALHGEPKLTAWMVESGMTGWYFRVLEPGRVSVNDELVRLERSAHGVSVQDANRTMHHERNDRDGLEKLLSVPELALAWRRPLQLRLGKLNKEMTA